MPTLHLVLLGLAILSYGVHFGLQKVAFIAPREGYFGCGYAAQDIDLTQRPTLVCG